MPQRLHHTVIRTEGKTFDIVRQISPCHSIFMITVDPPHGDGFARQERFRRISPLDSVMPSYMPVFVADANLRTQLGQDELHTPAHTENRDLAIHRKP